jgi:two-component system phosphate regulon sensor histidine kinase PhoR
MSETMNILLAIIAIAALTALVIARQRLNRLRQSSRQDADHARQRYERDITEAHAGRDRLLNALGDAFLLVDEAGVIRFANDAAWEFFGGRELLGRPAGEVFLEPRLAAALFHCLETGEPVRSRVVLSQQSSPLGDLETRGINAWIIDAARLPTHEGGDATTRLIIRDVTTEHQTDQIRKDFVANASHELRTPMAIINGYLENLLDDDMVDDPRMARRFLGVMRKHAERITRIVEDMLVISRLESGEAGALKIEPFRFRSCINDVLERLESMIRAQQAEIMVNMNDEKFTLHGDRFYWTQVLFNLVENALKQNPHPGLRVEIGCQSDKDPLRIWVADNGIGIPSSDLPHIFRRFYRVEKHHSQQEIKGTGLGLSIVKRAIEAHGGTITVTSVPGRETKFLISLPQGSA